MSNVLYLPYTLVLGNGTLVHSVAPTVQELAIYPPPNGPSNVVLTQQFGTFVAGAYQWSQVKLKWVFLYDYASLCAALFSIAGAFVCFPDSGATVLPVGSSGDAQVSVTRNGGIYTSYTLSDTGVELGEPAVAGDVFFVAQQSPLKPATLIVPGGISDAPNTGLDYLRQNGAWVPTSTALTSYVQSVNGLTPGSGGAVTLTPAAIGASLIGSTLFTAPSVSAAVAALSVVPTSSVGADNGVAPLNSVGIVPNANLPNYIGSINGLTPTGNALNLGVSNIAGAVASVNGVNPVAGNVTLAVVNIMGAAPTASPTFTGVPLAPTAAPGTNTAQIATTAFVDAWIAANAYVLPAATVSTLGGIIVGSGLSIVSGTLSANVTSINGSTGAITGLATLASPAFTGNPSAPTATAGTNSTTLATTAFVNSAVSAGAYVLPNATTSTLGGVIIGSGLSVTSGTVSANVTTVAGRTGAVVLSVSDVSGSAPLASPALTGVPTAPTATTGTNTTQLATTAFVDASIAANAYVLPAATTSTLGGVIVGSGLSVASGTVSANVTTVAGRTGVVVLSVSDVSGAAPLANPALTGVPTAPTATAGTSTTQIATTAFVNTSYAPLASPSLTGVPTAPTASAGTSTTQLATTAFVATSYAPLASPALSGVPTAPTGASGDQSTQIANDQFVYNATRSTAARTVTAATGTVAIADQYVGVNYAGSVAISLNAGASFNQGQQIIIKDESGSASTHNITVTANGLDKIDGQSSFTIALNYGSVTMLWNNNHWSII